MTFTDNILLAGQIALALTAIGTLVVIIVKYTVLKPIKKYIDQATYQIQPYANGGRSLADVARAVNSINERLDGLQARIQVIETQVCNPSKAKTKKA